MGKNYGYPGGLVRDVLRVCVRMLERSRSEEIIFDSEEDLHLFLLSLLAVTAAIYRGYVRDSEEESNLVHASLELMRLVMEDMHGDGKDAL
jgi:hypothetical protein